MKRQPPTLERHKEIGTRLADTRDLLMDLQVELCASYGKSSQIYKCARTTFKHLLDLRAELDNAVRRENIGRRTQDIYYPMCLTGVGYAEGLEGA